MIFEWDSNKRAANLDKHGLDLTDGAAMFDGRRVFTYPSPRSDEQRHVTVGRLADVFVAVVWTQREAAVRLISFRRARGGERQVYHSLFD